VQAVGEGVPARAGDGERRMFSGGAEEILQDVRDLKALGVHSLDFGFPGTTAEEVLAAMRRFADAVMARA
jgi:hypothetical protein